MVELTLSEKRIKGLTAFQIKVIALVIMTLDHIGAFAFEIPIVAQYEGYLRRIGRLAAPLFLFLLVQSIRHTRNKPKFILRLYLTSRDFLCRSRVPCHVEFDAERHNACLSILSC